MNHTERKSIPHRRIQAELQICSDFCINCVWKKKKKKKATLPDLQQHWDCGRVPENPTDCISWPAVSEPLSSLSHTQHRDGDSESHDCPTPLPRHADPSSACLALHLSRLWTPCNTDTSKSCQINGCAEVVALRGDICCCRHQPNVSSAIRLWREMKNK